MQRYAEIVKLANSLLSERLHMSPAEFQLISECREDLDDIEEDDD
jgi:hypothetical protein